MMFRETEIIDEDLKMMIDSFKSVKINVYLLKWSTTDGTSHLQSN